MISVAEARPVLTTTDKINKRINAAVNGERNYWQKKLDENTKKNTERIQYLNGELRKAQETSKKLTSEKNAYEKKVKTDLDKLTKEKNDVVSDLNRTKSEFENTKKNLNTSIETLKKEIEQKTKEQETLNKKITDTEKAKKDAEDKAKKELDKTIKQYNSKIKKLNKKITQKSNQLKAKTTQLKNLNLSFETQSANLYTAEAKTYNDAEILKGTIRTLQSELKALITQAKFMDIDRMKRIKTIKNQVAIEKQNFAEQIKAIQEADVQNLLRIEKLNNLIQRLIAKNQKLEKAGKILETRLMSKIQALKKRQQQNAQQYKLLTEAYARAESKNLVAIDQLKQELKSVTMKNQSLIKLANHMNKVRRAEDIADSKMETNLLLKIENLKNELNIAGQKNENLVKNIEKTKKYIDNLKKLELDNSTKLQKEIQSLTTEIKTVENKYKELLQKYNNRENWAIEKLDINNNSMKLTKSAGLTGENPQANNHDQVNGDSVTEGGYPQKGNVLEDSSSAMPSNNEQLRYSGNKFMDDKECQKAVQNMENKYTQLLQNYERQEKWLMENFNKGYPQLATGHQSKGYYQAPGYYPEHNAQRSYYHSATPQIDLPFQQGELTSPYQSKTIPQSAENKMRAMPNVRNAQYYQNGIDNIDTQYNNRERWKFENLARKYAPSYTQSTDDYSPRDSFRSAGAYQENSGRNGYYHEASPKIEMPQRHDAYISRYGANGYQWSNTQPSYTRQDVQQRHGYPGRLANQSSVQIQNVGMGQECREKLRDIEDKYNMLLDKYNNREKWMLTRLNGKHTSYRGAPNDQSIIPGYQPNIYSRAEIAQTEYPFRSELQRENYPTQTSYQVSANSPAINEARNTVMQVQPQRTSSNEDELVQFALDTTLKAVEKMANYDKDKINASLKLIATEAEMPKKLSAIVEVIKDRYNPAIYSKVVQEIANMYIKGALK